MNSTADQNALYSELHPQLVYLYCSLSSGVILLYDQIITFSDEVDHIWKRKFTGASLLFVLNRYVTLLKIIVSFIWSWERTVEVCKLGELWYNLFDIVALFIFAAFSALRVWAIWGRDLRPFIVILPFTLVTPVLNTYRVSVESTVPAINPLPSPYGGCQTNPGLPLPVFIRFADTVRAFAIVTDAMVLILTWLKTHGIYRAAIKINIRPTISSLLLRDGTMYFTILLMFNIVDLIVNHTNANANPVNYFSDVVNCVLISRFMLNLRSIHSTSSQPGDTTFIEGHPDFIQSNILGDLGAAVDYTTSTSSSESVLTEASIVTPSSCHEQASCDCTAAQTPNLCDVPEWNDRRGIFPSTADEEAQQSNSRPSGWSNTSWKYGSRTPASEDVSDIQVVKR